MIQDQQREKFKEVDKDQNRKNLDYCKEAPNRRKKIQVNSKIN